MAARKYAHINWQTLRELIAKGATLKQLSADFQIPYRTLSARSYRERWNVMAIRANLPPRSKTERKDSQPHAQLAALQTGVMLPLVKLANFYQSADVALLRNDSARFMAFVNAALKVIQLNDAKQAESSPTINLTVLAARPMELAQAQTREVSQLPDSQSGVVGEITEGSSSVREAKK